MKSLTYPATFILIATLLAACSTAQPYAFDDVYYHPNNDPVRQVQKDPREDFNQTDQINYDGSYQNRYQKEVIMMKINAAVKGWINRLCRKIRITLSSTVGIMIKLCKLCAWYCPEENMN